MDDADERATERLRRLVANPRFASRPAEARKQVFQKIYSSARDKQRERILRRRARWRTVEREAR
jgi:hypothetical protein